MWNLSTTKRRSAAAIAIVIIMGSTKYFISGKVRSYYVNPEGTIIKVFCGSNNYCILMYLSATAYVHLTLGVG